MMLRTLSAFAISSLVCASLFVGCGSSDSDDGSGTTSAGQAGSSQAGSSQGGSSQAGSSQGGSSQGGSSQGGSSQAGASQGGSSQGGSSQGGSAQGGSAGEGAGGEASAGAGGEASAGAGGEAAAGAAGMAAKECKMPTPIVVGGNETGYATCGDGAVVKKGPATCSHVPRDGTVCNTQGGPGGPGGPVDCTTDAECNADKNGLCIMNVGGAGISCGCQYGCSSDSDCGDGLACLCGPNAGSCAKAACRGPADCGGLDCVQATIITFTQPGGLPCSEFHTELVCARADDACHGDGDCGGGEVCAVDMQGARRCMPQPMECPKP